MSVAASLSVVVPVYNAEPYLAEMFEACFLDGLRRHRPKDAELVIVDDASPLQEETRRLSRLAESILPTRTVRNPRNLGFAASVNAGLRLAGGGTILLLNSDARLTPGAVDSMSRVLASAPDVGMVGPMSNGAFGADLQQLDGFAPLRSYAADELDRADAFARALAAAGPPPIEAAFLMGFCLLLRRELLEKIGFLDEIFGLGYLEEVDWCFRARDAGWRLLVDRSCFVYHGGLKPSALQPAGGAQSMRTRPWSSLYHLARNVLYLRWKHGWREARSQRLPV